MSDTDIAELEERIASAMARIGRAVEGMAGTDAVPRSDHEAALTDLEAARGAQAEAEARATKAEAEIQRLNEALESEATAAAQLRERNATLKAAKEEAQARVATLEDELATLAETRAEDRAELDAVIAALTPLVEDQPHA